MISRHGRQKNLATPLIIITVDINTG